MRDGESDTAEAPPATPHEHLLYRLTGLLLVAWTAVVAASLAWNVYRERVEARVIAHREAVACFDNDRAIRLWASSYGGVYVSVQGGERPSPYLSHLPDRDVTTRSGRHLTLVNPAQMIREVDGFATSLGRPRSRIVSLHPLHPANRPDRWERSALERLTAGAAEVSELVDDQGEPSYRLMRPLVTRPACLKCHMDERGRVGEVQGGIVVTLPMAPLWAISHRHSAAIVAGHGLLWLTGIAGIGLARRRLVRESRERQAAEARLHSRTADLRHLFDHAPVSLWHEDFSAVKRRLDDLRTAGVHDIRAYLTDHPEVVRECTELVRVVNVNQAAVTLHGAASREELLRGLPRTFTKSSYEVFREELIAAAMGETTMAGEAMVQTVGGRPLHVLIKVFIDPHTPDWSNAYVAIIDLTERKQMEEAIYNALREKEALLREVHHRVKNNFQVITSLLMLQSRHIDDPHLRAVFQESVNRVHTMAMVHERLYQRGDLTTLEAGDYLRAIVADLKSLFGDGSRIATRVEADPIPLAADTAIPCGLIVNELVSNAFKHAFPDGRGGEIRVAFHRLEGEDSGTRYHLTVSDDGVGIDPDLSIEGVESVGLRLVTTLAARQLGGRVAVHHDVGTSFTIDFIVPARGEPHGHARADQPERGEPERRAAPDDPGGGG